MQDIAYISGFVCVSFMCNSALLNLYSFAKQGSPGLRFFVQAYWVNSPENSAQSQGSKNPAKIVTDFIKNGRKVAMQF